jgi:dTDP-4-dehydrorhamnose reductase
MIRSKKVRLLIIGASGFIGQELLRLLGPERAVGTFNTHKFAGGVHFDACTMRLTQLPIGMMSEITHCAILIANPLIDDYARDPQRSWDMNVRAVIDLVQDLRSFGIVPVFASSDAVFDGRTGSYDEEAPLSPIVTYGRHKAVIEWYLRSIPQPWLITRMSKTISTGAVKRSLIGGWMEDLHAGRHLRCAHDQRFSPASVEDVARALIALSERGATGVFNVGGPHALSRLELLEMLVNYIRLRVPLTADITPCSIHDFNFAERRPQDTSLDSRKVYATVGFAFRSAEKICEEAAQMFADQRAQLVGSTLDAGRSRPG